MVSIEGPEDLIRWVVGIMVSIAIVYAFGRQFGWW
jgi:hypothetical protein